MTGLPDELLSPTFEVAFEHLLHLLKRAVLSHAGDVLGSGQWHLRQIMVGVNAYGVNNPQVYINNAAQKFDASGRYTDEAGRELIRQLIENLAKLGGKLKG